MAKIEDKPRGGVGAAFGGGGGAAVEGGGGPTVFVRLMSCFKGKSKSEKKHKP